MKLFRTVSKAERDDYNNLKEFRTSQNTLEAKQFFKSEIAVQDFVRIAKTQHFSPPYKFVFSIDVDEECLDLIPHDVQELDRFTAITCMYFIISFNYLRSSPKLNAGSAIHFFATMFIWISKSSETA